MIKKVDTTNLPKKTNGNIDWKESVNHTCPFVYGDISGEFYIKDYKLEKDYMLLIEYNNREKWMSVQNFKYGNVGNVIGVHTSDYKFNIGDVLHQKNQDLIVKSRYRKQIKDRVRKIYTLTCCTCNNTYDTTEAILLQHKGCPVCRNKIIIEGYNDIPTTAPWMIPYFQGGYDEAKLYQVGSSKRLNFVCPICKNIIQDKEQICELYTSKLTKCICETKYTFPERMMMCILENSSYEYIHLASHKVLPWAKNFQYDFYIPQLNCIIETHGLQHYAPLHRHRIRKYQFEEIIENDRQKRELAKENGICYYFEIDCREQTIEWILNSSSESGLLDFLHVSTDSINIDETYEKLFHCGDIAELVQQQLNNGDIVTIGNIKKTYGISDKLARIIFHKLGIKNARRSSRGSNEYERQSLSEAKTCPV